LRAKDAKPLPSLLPVRRSGDILANA